MKPPVETVRVSKEGREALSRIKRRTGLQQWNEICRIALCRSLADERPIKVDSQYGENAIEIEWKTFAKPYEDIYSALIAMEAHQKRLPADKLLKAHIERGIKIISKDAVITSII